MFSVYVIWAVLRFNSVRSSCMNMILIPSTYWIYLFENCNNWFLDNWIALAAAIRIELTHHYVIPVSIFVVADTRIHSQPVYALAQNNPPSLILSVFPISSQSSPQRPLLSREVETSSPSEGPESRARGPGADAPSVCKPNIIRLRPTEHDT